MGYYCIVIDVHVYYSAIKSVAETFRDRHAPDQELLLTKYPHTYGFAHRIPRPINSNA